MSNGPFDVSKLGYRWRGVYATGVTYNEGDVVFKSGGAHVYKLGVWQPFGPGQQSITTPGALLTGGQIVTGQPGQTLFTGASNDLEFRYADDRNGTTAIALMESINEASPSHYAANDYMSAIMTDGSVRAWGRQTNGQSGLQNTDNSRTFPGRVPFPPGTPRIVKVVSCWSQTYYLDASGTLWFAGVNSSNVMSGNGVTGVVPTPIKINGVGVGNDITADTVIVDIYVGKDYADVATFGVMAKDNQGRIYAWGINRDGQLGVMDGANTAVAKLVPFTANTPISKVFIAGGYYGASCLIEPSGKAWIAGQGVFNFFGSVGDVQLNTHIPLNTSGKAVKKAVWSTTDFNGTAGVQISWGAALILENGEVFLNYDGGVSSAGFGYGPVGTSGIANFSGTPIHTNVDDFYFVQGQYPRAWALMKNGTVQFRGYSNYFGGNLVPDGTNTTSWITIGGSVLTNIVKLRVMAGQSANIIFALDNQGKLAIWGRNDQGVKGVGVYVGEPVIDYIRHERPIVDFQPSGYCWSDTINTAVHALDDRGRVLSWGSGAFYVTGDDDAESIAVPSIIRF